MIGIRNASAVLQNFINNNTNSVTIVNIPDSSNLNIANKSLLIAGSYFVNNTTAITSPLTIYASSLGILEKNNNSGLTNITITLSTSVINVGYLVEII
jgi:hypothetical protein